MSETLHAVVAPSNAEQARAWDGDEGAYWAEHADRFDRAVAAYHHALLDAAAIGPAERVLDIGCGTGQTTRDAARTASSGSALGVDLSSRMLEVARRRADDEGVTNAEFVQADAQVHPFEPAAFDVAISRTGAMFFADPVAAFGNLARALRPGGRMVLLTWQPVERNEWIRELFAALAAGRDLAPPPPTAPGPFSLSDPERVHRLLSQAGFRDVALTPLTAPEWFGADADDAQRFLVGLMGWLLADLDDESRAQALARLHASLAAHQTANGVLYESAAWLIRARRP